MNADDLPHGCTIYTLFKDMPDGSQVIIDFTKLRDGSIHILKAFQYDRKVVQFMEPHV